MRKLLLLLELRYTKLLAKHYKTVIYPKVSTLIFKHLVEQHLPPLPKHEPLASNGPSAFGALVFGGGRGEEGSRLVADPGKGDEFCSRMVEPCAPDGAPPDTPALPPFHMFLVNLLQQTPGVST